MAKKPVYKMGDGNPIATVKQFTKKSGKIRGKSKKHTRILKGICVHHTINRKGRVKPTLSTDTNNNISTCRMCGDSFKARTYSKDELKKLTAGAREVIGNGKFLAVATGAGNDAVRYFSEAGAMMAMFAKNYRKLAAIAEKQDQVKKKKKKKDRQDYSSLGSWR